MGFLSKLFRKKSVDIAVEPTSRTIENPECIKLLALKAYMNSLLSDNCYIPKSEYRTRLLDEKKIVEYFAVLENSGMLGSFCQTNGVDEKEIQDTFSCYSHFEELIDAHNDSFITRAMSEEKKYLDNILRDVDPQIKLDEDQRRVILTDEDYCLVIAGAGAGKTTTVAAKVKYLVEKKGVQPSQILVVSFTNKAVQELRDKLNKDLKIDCPIATFHSTGNAILRKQTDEKLNIVDNSKLYFVLQDYFRNSILKNESLVNNLILFFASYFDAPYEGDDLNNFFNKIAKSNFATLRSDLNEFKQQIMDIHHDSHQSHQLHIICHYYPYQDVNQYLLQNLLFYYYQHFGKF